jgi:CCR4-NOT transcription complex subunit 6
MFASALKQRRIRATCALAATAFSYGLAYSCAEGGDPLFSRRFVGPVGPVGGSDDASRQANIVRIISHNVLGDGKKYALSLKHSYCPPQFIDATYRFPRVIEMLQHHNPDIIALQEVQVPFAHAYVIPNYNTAQWFYLYSTRMNLRQSQGLQVPESELNTSGGDLLLIRKDAFEVEGYHVFPYFAWSSVAGRANPDIAILSNSQQEGVEILAEDIYDKGDSVEMVLLRHKATNKQLCVANTHIHWDPRFPHIKALQALILTHSVADFLQTFGLPATGKNAPALVVAGDMNSFSWKKDYLPLFDLDRPPAGGEPSGVVKLFTSGTLPATHHEHPARRGVKAFPTLRSALDPLSSVYTQVLGGEPPITTKTTTFEGNIDQIYVNSKAKVTGVLEMPYVGEEGAAKFPAIPNAIWPSDHIALGVEIDLVK